MKNPNYQSFRRSLIKHVNDAIDFLNSEFNFEISKVSMKHSTEHVQKLFILINTYKCELISGSYLYY